MHQGVRLYICFLCLDSRLPDVQFSGKTYLIWRLTKVSQTAMLCLHIMITELSSILLTIQISAITIYKTDPGSRFLLRYTVEMLPQTELLLQTKGVCKDWQTDMPLLLNYSSKNIPQTMNVTDVSLPCITSLLLRFSKTRILDLEWWTHIKMLKLPKSLVRSFVLNYCANNNIAL